MDEDSIIVEISKANNPPSDPTVDGTTYGHKNITYEFTMISTDADNDTIQYIIEWGDGNLTTTEFLQNGISINMSHKWIEYGVYTISVKAYDGKTDSGVTEYIVWIDVWPIDDEITGLLVDKDSNDPFDLFDNIDTGEQIDVEKENKKDYAFDLETGLTTYPEYVYQKYKSIFEEEISTPGFEIISLMAMIGVVLIILRRRR